jgi:hypothetical protein
MLGRWQATRSVQDATALGVVITNTLGATPEEIKADQRKLENDLTEEQYKEALEKYAGKGRLWQAVHYWLHPEDRLDNIRAGTLAKLDTEARAEFQTEAVLAGAGSETEDRQSGVIGWIRNRLGI